MSILLALDGALKKDYASIYINTLVDETKYSTYVYEYYVCCDTSQSLVVCTMLPSFSHRLCGRSVSETLAKLYWLLSGADEADAAVKLLCGRARAPVFTEHTPRKYHGIGRELAGEDRGYTAYVCEVWQI